VTSVLTNSELFTWGVRSKTGRSRASSSCNRKPPWKRSDYDDYDYGYVMPKQWL